MHSDADRDERIATTRAVLEGLRALPDSCGPRPPRRPHHTPPPLTRRGLAAGGRRVSGIVFASLVITIGALVAAITCWLNDRRPIPPSPRPDGQSAGRGFFLPNPVDVCQNH